MRVESGKARVRALLIAVVLWAVSMAMSLVDLGLFVSFAPENHGTLGFLWWQGLAVILAATAFFVGRTLLRGSRCRRLSLFPAVVSGIFVAGWGVKLVLTAVLPG